MLNIFEVLKIKSYTISENAKKRLKEVGINSDGNLTLNGKEIEEMPELLDRLKELKKSDMTTIMGKKVITEKEKEDEISWSDVYNLNYTLRYSEPTAVMTQLNNSSNYTPGNNVYQNNYASSGTSVAGSVASTASSGSNTFTSSKTKTGSAIWTAIATIVNKAVTVSSGTTSTGEKIIDHYIRRLYKADAKWANIAKVIQGHKIKPAAQQQGWTQNLVIRTIYYIKKDNLSAAEATRRAQRDEKIYKGDLGAQLDKAGESLTNFFNSLTI